MPEDRINDMMDMEDEIYEQGQDIEYDEYLEGQIKEKIKERLSDEYLSKTY